MQFLNTAKERFTAWRQERKDRAAQHPTRQFHGDAFLITFLLALVIAAGVVEWLWAVLFTINTTGQLELNSTWSLGSPVSWVAAFDARWPVLLGRAAAVAVIVGWSMIWLPVWFMARGGGRWLRFTMAFFGLLCNALVVLQGTFVLNETRQDEIRGEMVVEQSAAQGRIALQTQLDLAREELRAITNPDLTSYQAQAARDGAAAWARRVEIARQQNDYQFPAIERAIVSAERADDLRRDVARLTTEIRQATPEAATVAAVEDVDGVAINTLGRLSEVYWPLVAALGTTGIGIFGAWWLVYIWARARSVDVSGWADAAHRIEDMREREAPAAQPMEPAREAMYDAETGEELVFRRGSRPTYARKPKRKGKPETVETQPEIPPDEVGVEHDGGGRSGSALPEFAGLGDTEAGEEPRDGAEDAKQDQVLALGVQDAIEPGQPGNGADEQRHNDSAEQGIDEQLSQPEPSEELPDLTEEETLALLADEPPAEDTTQDAGEHNEPRAEPETDERRLIAAE